MIPFFTISPISRIRPMKDETFSGVPVTQQQPERADERQRRRRQDHERGREAPELRHQHPEHQQHGDREHQQHRAERGLLALVQPADARRSSRPARDRRASAASTSRTPLPRSAALEPRRHRHHLLQVLPVELRLALRRGRSWPWSTAARSRPSADVSGNSRIQSRSKRYAVGEPHAHVDQAVAAPERRRHLAEQAGRRAGSPPARP